MRILILEDDPAIATLLEDALRTKGHEPTSFAHAGLALGAIARGKFELLLCDLMLPNVNGFDAMRMARSQFPYLPIIAISALEEAAWREQAFAAGASCYLQKPLRLDRLYEEIDLVKSSQVDLTIAVVDSDRAHCEHVARDLATLGCDVRAFAQLEAFHADPTFRERSSVLLIEAGAAGLQDELNWCAAHDVAAVPFGTPPKGVDDDQMLRWGASFCQLKPVDTQALVIQARFFVSPVGRG